MPFGAGSSTHSIWCGQMMHNVFFFPIEVSLETNRNVLIYKESASFLIVT